MTTSESQQTKLNLKKAYREICLGFSPFFVNGSNLYFKHLTVFDKIRCDEFYEEAYRKAINFGKKTEKEIFEEAKKNKEWTSADERGLESYKKDLIKMRESRSKSLYEDQVEEIDEIIEEYTKALLELSRKKELITQNSAESSATGEYIINFLLESVYVDDKLTKQKWDAEEKDYLKVSHLTPYFNEHNKIFSRFSNENLKKIAICDYFQEGFSLVTDMSQFFNKKVFDMSDYQVRLLKYGSTFKEVLTEAYDAPDDYYNSPEKLEQWYILKKNRANNPDYKNAQSGEASLRNFLDKENV